MAEFDNAPNSAPDPFVRRKNKAGEHEPFALTTLATFDSLRLYECRVRAATHADVATVR